MGRTWRLGDFQGFTQRVSGVPKEFARVLWVDHRCLQGCRERAFGHRESLLLLQSWQGFRAGASGVTMWDVLLRGPCRGIRTTQ